MGLGLPPVGSFPSPTVRNYSGAYAQDLQSFLEGILMAGSSPQQYLRADTDLQSLVKTRLWTAKSGFPPSHPLGDRVSGLGNGLYVLVNPVRGAGDQAYAVGWAQSDYWARRAFDGAQFRDDLTPPPPHWRLSPSLAFLGRPSNLSYKTIKEYEKARTGANNLLLVTAHYRITIDGAFLYCSVNGSDGITYMYASNRPKARDEPVAIEFRLPEGEQSPPIGPSQ